MKMKRNVLIAALLICVIVAVIIATSAFSFKSALPFFGGIIVQKSATMCSESDNGVFFYAKGTISLCTGTNCEVKEEDICKDSSNLTEYYCTAKNEIKTVNLNCPYGCDDGACMTIGQKSKVQEQETAAGEKTAEEQVKKIICDEGWQCTGKSKIYQNLDCSLAKETYCKYGCNEGDCKTPAFWEKFLLWLNGQVI